MADALLLTIHKYSKPNICEKCNEKMAQLIARNNGEGNSKVRNRSTVQGTRVRGTSVREQHKRREQACGEQACGEQANEEQAWRERAYKEQV